MKLNFREWIAIVMIGVSIITLGCIAYGYIHTDKTGESAERVFREVLPLLATWIGTVLAFYFGRENFEAASNRYEQIIDKLSPDILDDVSVNQIMITRKTLVSLTLAEARNKKVKGLRNFLDSVNKTRLPIFEGDKIKYIIHKSTLNEALQAIAPSGKELEFDDFVKQPKYKELIESFIVEEEGKTLETIRNKMKAGSNVKDVFISDTHGHVIGWLTDTLILRYMKV